MRIGRPIYNRVVVSHWMGNGLTWSIVPARGLRFEEAGVVARPKTFELSLLGRRGGKIERCSVDQHPMHDHGELAGKRHLCLFHPGALGEPHGPALEGRALDRLCEDG